MFDSNMVYARCALLLDHFFTLTCTKLIIKSTKLVDSHAMLVEMINWNDLTGLVVH